MAYEEYKFCLHCLIVRYAEITENFWGPFETILVVLKVVYTYRGLIKWEQQKCWEPWEEPSFHVLWKTIHVKIKCCFTMWLFLMSIFSIYISHCETTMYMHMHCITCNICLFQMSCIILTFSCLMLFCAKITLTILFTFLIFFTTRVSLLGHSRFHC